MGHDHGGGEARRPPRPADRRPGASPVVVLLVEVVGAAVSGSLALLADAGHMLTDVAGLTLAVVASVLSRRPATDARTWGYRRAEVLAAAAQAAVLLAVGVFVLVEGVRRLLHPPEVTSGAMVVFGVVGLVGEHRRPAGPGRRARRHPQHAGRVPRGGQRRPRARWPSSLAAAVIALTGWMRADAVASLVIGVLIIPRTVRLLLETVDVLLESTPKGLDLAGVRARILSLPHVHDLHDLHASQVATGLPVLTAHVVVDDSCFHDGHLGPMLDELQRCLDTDFDVEHSTIQFEAAAHADHEHETHA